ncbi:hypothetical protein V6N11_069230 [Hibiscus sabdariffa]|uniref:Uncharacterized protein n=1 Tax=Hibiscus sabdariffa TaxID=183260 RepID=A0ABR2NB19_9ROSI
MPRLVHRTISVAMGFMLRKSLSVFQELSWLLLDLASLLISAIRYSSLRLFRHRQRPRSSADHRHYRRLMSPMSVPT